MEWTRGDAGEGLPKHKMNGTAQLPDPNNVAISASHRGSIQVYMAPYSSNGKGPAWTKIWSSAYSEGSWATDKLIKAKGLHTVHIPSVKAGKYLVRSEINALHDAAIPYNKDKGHGAQLYPSCMQIEVTRNGQKNLTLPGGTSFPGITYRYNSTGIVWNLYNGSNPKKYKAPGPVVWSGAVGGFFGLKRTT